MGAVYLKYNILLLRDIANIVAPVSIIVTSKSLTINLHSSFFLASPPPFFMNVRAIFVSINICCLADLSDIGVLSG
jgi:hypothetical protein